MPASASARSRSWPAGPTRGGPGGPPGRPAARRRRRWRRRSGPRRGRRGRRPLPWAGRRRSGSWPVRPACAAPGRRRRRRIAAGGHGWLPLGHLANAAGGVSHHLGMDPGAALAEHLHRSGAPREGEDLEAPTRARLNHQASASRESPRSCSRSGGGPKALAAARSTGPYPAQRKLAHARARWKPSVTRMTARSASGPSRGREKSAFCSVECYSSRRWRLGRTPELDRKRAHLLAGAGLALAGRAAGEVDARRGAGLEEPRPRLDPGAVCRPRRLPSVMSPPSTMRSSAGRVGGAGRTRRRGGHGAAVHEDEKDGGEKPKQAPRRPRPAGIRPRRGGSSRRRGR